VYIPPTPSPLLSPAACHSSGSISRLSTKLTNSVESDYNITDLETSIDSIQSIDVTVENNPHFTEQVSALQIDNLAEDDPLYAIPVLKRHTCHQHFTEYYNEIEGEGETKGEGESQGRVQVLIGLFPRAAPGRPPPQGSKPLGERRPA